MHQGSRKRIIAHVYNKALWEEQSGLLERAEGGNWFTAFCWLGSGAEVRLLLHRLGNAWVEPPAGAKVVGSTPGFLNSLLSYGQKDEEEWWNLKDVSNQTSKMYSLIFFFLHLLYFNIKIYLKNS